ncbi:two-component regulator propeller domain-containing protein [Flexithrix dorotheae]|uniref:two-component regulator propeller domain-containing protein n=1 Tax=Flexithrix dorotheae TaxID=70993 RepID=UPI0003800566|nr:two-component regulator propeller domain-containing protein [Flexithrix dorotheae]
MKIYQLIFCKTFIALFLLLSFHSLAQKPKGLSPKKAISQYKFKLWTSENGLPTNGALSIIQAKNGYLWIGTFNGLVKFDGININVIDHSKIPHFKSNTFTNFYEDADSSLWIGSQGGIVVFKNNKWKVYTVENGLPSSNVDAIFKDKKGTVWAGTASGLCYLKDSSFTNSGLPEELKGINVYDILQDDHENLWLSTNGKGIFSYNLETKTFKNYNSENGLSDNYVRTLTLDKKGNLWIPTGKGLDCLLPEGEIKSYSEKDGLNDNSVAKVFEDSQGVIWIGTSKGLARLYKGEISTLGEKEELAAHNVTDILEDNEGNIWVTTYRSGLYQLHNGKFTNFTREEGLTGKLVYSIAKNDENSYLIATNNGLSIINGNQISDLKTNKPLPDQVVRDVFKDSKGIIWASTTKGLAKIENGNTTVFTEKDGLPSDYIRLCYEDHYGNIWIGTPNGLAKYSNGRFITFTKEDGLSNNFILSVFQDSKGRMWISTRQGITRLSGGKFEHFNTKDGLAGEVNFRFFEDKEGVIWIGANGGLTRYKDDTFTVLNKQHGLFTDIAFSILEDDDGYFWITCNDGIYKVKREELNLVAEGKIEKATSILYNKDDGMKVSECTANARPLKSKDGRLWFPTFDGITVIDPSNITINPIPPKVVIEGINVNGTKISDIQHINLSPDNQRIKINFTGLSYSNPEKVFFKYKLEGFENNWQIAGSNREVFYTNLPPGNFTFKVIAKNHDGIWNEKGTKIVFFKPTQFYKTTAFFITTGLVVFTLIVLIFKYRVRNIRNQNNELEKMVQKRTMEMEKQQKEAIAQKDKLEETYRNFQQLSEIGQLVTSHLNVKDIVNTVYEQIDHMMNVSIFAVALYNEKTRTLDFTGREPGSDELLFDSDSIDQKDMLSAYCYNQQEELLITDIKTDTRDFVERAKNNRYQGKWKSAIYLPLNSKDIKLGVIALQSEEPCVYQDYHIDILRNLAVYIGIAISNANNYAKIEESNSEIAKQHEVISNIHNKVTASINYARRIQEAALPSLEKMRTGLKDVFVLYKPKDIVSGDFYWYSEVKGDDGNSKIVVVAADCTGHGVPGAIMSIAGENFLNQVVNIRGITSPDLILQELDKSVRTAFRQDTSNNKDGMDIALCVIDKKKKEIEFAGAYNPLIFIENNELNIIKGNKVSIGGQAEGEKVFKKNKVKIGETVMTTEGETTEVSEETKPSTPMTCYIFSDGFPDQFSPIHKRKFLLKRFKEKLLEIHHRPLEEQKLILDSTLEDWKGDEKQIDDILVVGFRIF